MSDQSQHDPEGDTPFGELPEDPQGDRAPAPEPDAGETLSRVRDLLFGETSRAQTERVDGLESLVASELGQMRAAHEQELAELRSEFRQEVETLGQRLDRLHDSKVARADLASLLRGLAEKLDGDDSAA